MPAATEVSSHKESYLRGPVQRQREMRKPRDKAAEVLSLQLRADQVTRVKWTRHEVERRIELRQPLPERFLVTEPQHQVPAGRRLDPEDDRPEAEAPARPQPQGQAVRQPDLRPAPRRPVAL